MTPLYYDDNEFIGTKKIQTSKVFEATKSRGILNYGQAGRVQWGRAPLPRPVTKFCTSAQTPSDCKEEIKVLLNSPETVFVAWQTPKRKQ